MLGQRSPQRGFFDADVQYLDRVGRSSFYGFVSQHRGELFRDEDFAAFYAAQRGRPSVPPSLLATALLLQTYDGVSDEEARDRAAFDLRWKVALGVAVEEQPFAKSTLQEFRAQLVLHEQQRVLFQASLELAKRRGWFRGRKLQVAVDTTNILGRGAVKDTYNLLADGIVQVLRALAAQGGAGVAACAERLRLERYVAPQSLKGQAAVAWEDPAAQRRFLQGVVADAERVLEQVRQARSRWEEGSAQDLALREAAGLLSRLLLQDLERREDGPALREGVASDRVVSVHDPEMRHGRKSKAKRFNGHKAQVAVDTDTQLVTAVAVLAGNAPVSLWLILHQRFAANVRQCFATKVHHPCGARVHHHWGRLLLSGILPAARAGRCAVGQQEDRHFGYHRVASHAAGWYERPHDNPAAAAEPAHHCQVPHLGPGATAAGGNAPPTRRR